MMNSLEDVIKKDTKWLLHFLKENHCFNQYVTKMNAQKEQPICYTYENWVNFIKQNDLTYVYDLIRFSNNNMWVELLKNDKQLLNSITLFSDWRFKPFTLSNSEQKEWKSWLKIKDDYILFKEFIFTIYKNI